MTEWGEHPLPACPGPGPDAHMLQAQKLVRTHGMTGMISLGGQAGETAQTWCGGYAMPSWDSAAALHRLKELTLVLAPNTIITVPATTTTFQGKS